jgi:hypothetical protein
MRFYAVRNTSQELPKIDVSGLKPEDRRVIFGSSLQWIWQRYKKGQRVYRRELLRLADLADDAGERKDVRS